LYPKSYYAADSIFLAAKLLYQENKHSSAQKMLKSLLKAHPEYSRKKAVQNLKRKIDMVSGDSE
jgi:TolA-binding protein